MNEQIKREKLSYGVTHYYQCNWASLGEVANREGIVLKEV